MRYLNSLKTQDGIVLYDYLTHLKPDEGSYWIKLADNYALGGDCPYAISAYRKSGSTSKEVSLGHGILFYCVQYHKHNSWQTIIDGIYQRQ